VVAALVLGVAVAAITASRPGGDSVALASPQPPSVSPAFPVSPLPASGTPTTHRSAKPTTSSSAATTSPPPTGVATSAPPSSAGIALDPTAGARGTSITVTGHGWTPGSIVTVRYSGTLAGSGNTVDVDSQGRFTTQVTANAALPGNYTVSATDGSQTDSEPFRQTT
jgi:hypothetical protein